MNLIKRKQVIFNEMKQNASVKKKYIYIFNDIRLRSCCAALRIHID